MSTLQVIARIKRACKGGEVLEPALDDHARVLDADSTEAKEIKAGLDRHDVAFLQSVLARPAQRRLLVHVEPDAVAGGVVHPGASLGALESPGRRPVAPVHKDLADAVVNFAARGPGSNRLDPRIERLEDRGVHAPDLVRDIAHDERSGEIAVIVSGPAGGKDVDD